MKTELHIAAVSKIFVLMMNSLTRNEYSFVCSLIIVSTYANSIKFFRILLDGRVNRNFPGKLPFYGFWARYRLWYKREISSKKLIWKGTCVTRGCMKEITTQWTPIAVTSWPKIVGTKVTLRLVKLFQKLMYVFSCRQKYLNLENMLMSQHFPIIHFYSLQ